MGYFLPARKDRGSLRGAKPPLSISFPPPFVKGKGVRGIGLRLWVNLTIDSGVSILG